uniref:AlNc14C148G7434 protein n=2 Tax=Albugo laibachii Nc14 TaxID=890382 RepID=F0WLQ2_9STRA|nr:AlNc14C148G7434 [Albugo laibachii Nc14]|eukprot:CCA22224.1 AlNc14C148G7434 [Albugo laibachii Nc14]
MTSYYEEKSALKSSNRKQNLQSRWTRDGYLTQSRCNANTDTVEDNKIRGVINSLCELDSKSCGEAMMSQGKHKWMTAVSEELKALEENGDPGISMIVGRPVISRLGYSLDTLLVIAKQKDSCGMKKTDGPKDSDIQSNLIRIQQVCTKTLFGSLEGDEDDQRDFRTAFSEMQQSSNDTVRLELKKKIKNAKDNDFFRLKFGQDPAVEVDPLRVILGEDAPPVRCRLRRYAPLHQQFLETHMKELANAGLVFENHRSHWASPPRIVAKKEPGQYRMTVDTRAVNAKTEAMRWPMPHLESVIACVEGAEVFFSIDWFRGYWQIPLHHESQELHTIMTHTGLWTPNRVLMGATDAVVYCQGVVEQIFGPLLYHKVLACLDDILGYAKTEGDLLDILKEVLENCPSFGLKLNPKKCKFFERITKCWPGRYETSDNCRAIAAVPLSGQPDEVQHPTLLRAHSAIYMLLRQNGFRLFIDYRNLVHMFDPLASINHFARYQVDKLQHLAMNLTNFQYKIDFISGEDIVWSDMLSRWGAAPVKNVQEKQFAWPAMNEVPEVQNENLSDKASKDRPIKCTKRVDTAELKRKQARDRRSKRQGVHCVNFEIDDFILVAQVFS